MSLEFKDLIINSNDKSLKLKLFKSKKDSHAIGKNLYLSNEAQRTLKERIYKSKISSEKIFRAINVSRKIKGNLSSSPIGCIFKKRDYESKMNPEIIKDINSHSVRVSEAQDLMLS